MAGIPVGLFERAYGANDAIVSADSPVLYEVWREYAVRGPQSRLRVLLRLAENTNSASAAAQLRQAGIERPGVMGEWLLITTDLEQLVRDVLPLTRWGHSLSVVKGLDPEAIVDLLAPLDELLGQGEADQSSPATEHALPLTLSEEEVVVWLLRLLARLWGYDSDLDSERFPAAQFLLGVLAGPAVRNPAKVPQVGFVESISLDRLVRPSAIGSAHVIKADAVRRLFDIRTSSLNWAWAVLDTGINARHPAFRAPAGSGSATRVVETFDLTRLSDDQLEVVDPKKGPLDHLVDVVGRCAVPAWDGGVESGYRQPVLSHGTHVAGILAGNEPGVYEGTCPGLPLWDFRVIDDQSVGNESRVLLALRYIRHLNDRERTLRIAGVNMSISLAYNPKNDACGWTPVCVEVRRLVRSGVVVVVAAGNAGYEGGAAAHSGAADGVGAGMTAWSKGTGFETVSITDPGNAEEVITVGATHGEHPFRYGTSYFSGKGPTADGRLKPDLLAPGERIFGPVGREAYKCIDGTSQAAPYVSGAAALLMARYPELVGEPGRIKDILCRTATDLGRDRLFQGHGLVDVLRAAQSI